MDDNSSGATRVTDNSWKTPSGQHFTTPSKDAPIYGSPISIHNGNGGSDAGTWISGEAVKNSTGS
jgi:hypothetical protein